MTAKNILEKIPDLILAQLAAFSLVYGLTSSLMLTYPPLNILLIVMLFTLMLFSFFYNRITSIVASVFLGASLLVTFLYMFTGIGLTRVISFLDGYFYWLGDFVQYPAVPDPLFQMITVIVLCLFMSVFTYIFIVRKFIFLVITIAGMGIFTVQSSFNIISNLAPFYVFLLVTLVSYLKHIYKKKTLVVSNEYAKSSIMTIWSIPVCIIVIAIAFSFHASNKPIEWKWLDKKVVSVYNFFNRNMDYETFDYFSLSASSGFGDRNNILGGRVRLDKTNVMKISTAKTVYLKGAIKDVYTGTHWINSSAGKSPLGKNYDVIYTDTNEMLEGMKLLTGDKDFLKNLFFSNKISVTYMNLKTKSLFLPEKAISFLPKKGDLPVLVDNIGSLSTTQRLSKGFSYKVALHTPDIGNKAFVDVIRKSRKGLYNEYLKQNQLSDDSKSFKFLISSQSASSSTIIVKSNATSGSSVTFSSISSFLTPSDSEAIIKYSTISQLKENSDRIYKMYLQLPPNLPQRVKDLATSLVAGRKTDYDKAKAIEQYLAKKYPYNLDVRSTPRNRDFVDYFLFDLKQGYCSYYASAMAVLARCAGLPSRYVEGYMLPPEPTKDNPTTYIVTNMQAHAWVEIYFEGYGWLPFEPTSPFVSDFYSSQKTEVKFSSNYDPSYEDYIKMMRERYGGAPDFDSYNNDSIHAERTPVGYILLTITGSLLLLFILLLLFNMTRSRYKLYKIVNLPAKDCIIKFYDYYAGVLSMMGYGLVPAETAIQYSGRIDSLLFFSPVRFKAITDIFTKARYSLKEANEKEKQLLCDFHQPFIHEVKINMGKFKYFTLKYILGRF